MNPAAGDGCPASAEYMSATKSTSTVAVRTCRSPGLASQDRGHPFAKHDFGPLGTPPGGPAVLATAKLPRLRFHDLRRSHATHMLASGVHPKIASDRLGHATVGFALDTYSRVIPGMQEDAVARIDAGFASTVVKPVGWQNGSKRGPWKQNYSSGSVAQLDRAAVS